MNNANYFSGRFGTARVKLFSCLLLLFIVGCTGEKTENHGAKNTYFDVKGFFDQEANRINQLNPTVVKTVSIQGNAETKSVKINDWKKELSAFSAGEIKKVAWDGLFTVQKNRDTTIYSSSNKKVQVKKLKIVENSGQIQQIEIDIIRENVLFVSKDHLIYYPDSLYTIQRQQDIKLMPSKKYAVTVRLN